MKEELRAASDNASGRKGHRGGGGMEMFRAAVNNLL